MRYILLSVLLCLSDISFLSTDRYAFGQAVWNGYTYNAPVCSKPNCAMCNAIRTQLAAQSTPTPQPTTYTTQYETRAVTKQVKRCNGRTCWYETVTEYIQVPTQVSFRSDTSVNEVFRNEVPTPAPTLPQPSILKKDISLDLVPTPKDAIPILVSLLRPTPYDVFIEPGCGDGRVLQEVGKTCTSIGIELNQDTARLASDNLGKDAIVLVGDATQADYTRATIVSMYLYPNVMEKIVPLLQPGTRIVSYCHTIPGIKCQEYISNGHTFYVGVK